MASNNFKADLNEASIVELKAELYKKELEARQKGLGTSGSAVVHKKSKTLQKIAINTGKYKKNIKAPAKPQSTLTDAECEKLKEVSSRLDAKARLYDKLKKNAQQGTGSSKLEEMGILVDFEKKALQEPVTEGPSFFEVIQAVEAEHREKMNIKWEEERAKLKEKPLGQEHYQDVFFNELREHGVGYYHFSSDENQRTKELELLKKLRDETVHRREKNIELKRKREQAIAERLAKIRKRKGLPEEPIKECPKIEESFSPPTIEESIDDLIKESKNEQYVEEIEKRINVSQPLEDERNPDFAPPTNYSTKKRPKSGYYFK